MSKFPGNNNSLNNVSGLFLKSGWGMEESCDQVQDTQIPNGLTVKSASRISFVKSFLFSHLYEPWAMSESQIHPDSLQVQTLQASWMANPAEVLQSWLK